MQLCKTEFFQPEKKYDWRYITRHSAGLLLLEMVLIEPTCDGLGVYVIYTICVFKKFAYIQM